MASNVVIYGIGTIAQLWLKSNKSIQIEFFLSNNPTETSYMGIPVKNINDVFDKNQYTVLVAVSGTKYRTHRNNSNLLFGEDLLSMLRNLGFDKVYSFADSSKIYFPNFLKQIDVKIHLPWTSDCFKTAREYDLENSFSLRLLRQKLIDESSRLLLDSLIRFRQTLDFTDYPSPQSFSKQWLDPTFIDKIDKITMLDAGSYNGDSAEDLMDFYNHKIEHIYCVEPSFENLLHLINFRNSHQKYLEKITLVSAALGDKNEFAIMQDSEETSRLGNFNTKSEVHSKQMAIPVCTFDSYFTNMGINLIKMDIEGYELNAIKGAEKYIRERAPYMAIAVYHKPTDIYAIPNKILEINPGYTFILRLYSECLEELVLYCIPNS